MHVIDLIKRDKRVFSFEFFPPKDDKASEQLFQTIASLIELRPSYVSVTYGAGGSTRELTHGLVVRLHKETDLTVVSHLTCVGSTRTEIHNVLRTYCAEGICNIMALRGDPPKGQDRFVPPSEGFAHAAELVAYVKRHFPGVAIGVAGYPEGHVETPNRLTEIDYLKAKVDAGADYVCTQLFFDNHDYFDFCERCELAGITVPVIAGIMPVTGRKGMLRMADLAAGSRFPAKLLKALSRAQDDAQFEAVGVHWATEQVLDLLDNDAPGVHFYTLNRSKATLEIYKALGVTSSSQLR